MTPAPEAPTPKRLLFVDDDPLVIEGLRRMLRPMRREWDMHFESSALDALKAMESQPFDIVVSDMRMPIMNGAEFLNVVMKRFPRTIRFILSGYADDTLILKCIGSTHQFLSKPCDPEVLKQAVRRAVALEERMTDPKLRQLVSQITHLPSLPSLYLSIVEVLQDPNVPMKRVAEIISQDIGMSARILNLVNSAFFGLVREISDLHEAVAYIGLDIIKSLVLSLNLISQFERAHCKHFDPEQVWRHSLRVAVAARRIAVQEKTSPHIINEAFVAGLLHNCGQLILANNFGEEYAAIQKLPAEQRHAEELERFKASYADIGGYLLGLWGLPVPIVEAVSLHQHPSDSLSRQFGSLCAVHAANALVLQGPRPDILPHFIDVPYLQSLNLFHHLDVWRDCIRDGFTPLTESP